VWRCITEIMPDERDACAMPPSPRSPVIASAPDVAGKALLALAHRAGVV